MSQIFEKQFKEAGFKSQRRYPNEFLIQFLASNFFHHSDRGQVKILEIGSGSGANLWMIAREGFDTYGIDSAPTGVELSKKMLESWGVKANVKVGSMTKLDFQNNFFDAVVDVVSIQHLNWKEHDLCLQEIKRVLKPSGKFFTFHLGGGSSAAGKGEKIDKFTIKNIPENFPLSGNGPTCFPTSKALEKKILANAFKIVSSEKMQRTYKKQKQKVEYLVVSAEKA